MNKSKVTLDMALHLHDVCMSFYLLSPQGSPLERYYEVTVEYWRDVIAELNDWT